MRAMRKFRLFLLLFISAWLVGCSNAAEMLKEMDAPQINYIEEDEELDKASPEEKEEGTNENQEAQETVERELYLITSDGMVAPYTFSLPKTESVLRQSLEYLVEDGPISSMLPNGFRAVIPVGTEIDVNLKEDGTAIVDFSEEFKNYHPDDEVKILQAITWTLTQFDNVDKVRIRINGYDQETMPVNHTPIGDGYSRKNGINIETDDVVDIVNSTGVTLYFLAQNGDDVYYVPVTRRVKEESNMFAVIVNELLKGPSAQSNLLTDFREGVELVEEPKYENGVVTLNFNEMIFGHLQGTAISENVVNMLALSLTEQEGVEKIAIRVNGDANVLMASGKVLAEPVSRPEFVNTGKF